MRGRGALEVKVSKSWVIQEAQGGPRCRKRDRAKGVSPLLLAYITYLEESKDLSTLYNVLYLKLVYLLIV